MPTPQTKTDAAVEALRDALLRGDIRPGERVLAVGMARQLGMSATPVREAIRILQTEGLLTQEPHRSGAVATLGPSEVDELYMLRAILEGKATELATRAATASDIEALAATHKTLVDSAAHGSKDFTATNADWHFAIYTMSNTRWLREFIVRLWVRVPWNQIYVAPGRCDISVQEHAEILEAMRAGDAERAGQLMSDHVTSGLRTLETLLERPDAG
ncbi:GntR family transcriptional regulator [Plantactinospora sp. GCM10030261]|uniref:GntR family transcriptional regulator n=1 Tax=Plantactinospora sp. GCM10030261 TaxID=3273420 RepID=UPI00360F9D02